MNLWGKRNSKSWKRDNKKKEKTKINLHLLIKKLPLRANIMKRKRRNSKVNSLTTSKT